MGKIQDVSLGIHPGMPTWPGDPKLSIDLVSRMEDGENANVSRLVMSVHTGTHVDAPFHFVSNGVAVDALALDTLIGTCQVVEIDPAVGLITAEEVLSSGINNGVKRVLFKTRNSNIWARGENRFQENFVALSPDAAEAVVDMGIELVGIDYLSIAPFNEGIPTHTVLLQNDVIVIEGLNLAEISAGMYRLVCLPLKLLGADGAPARVVLERI
jgi:arylformamidase